MNTRFTTMLHAIEDGARRGKVDARTARELDGLFRRCERAGLSIVTAHAEAVERRLLPPLRQGVVAE
ncbi:hypothetical protein [Azospirillum rugosum]|uniref:Resolvase, N terminal domain n=1 Tax=Azospirillum rugosum TaxID=416170 RepID=A0ABS4SDU1_9PROT|nr:hypothetical protein [Azospirillum rugosum]MBP2290745.1 hypothetical protein [Azospirillum rugosum]MDQ0525634.1 hypothetical protein [Azospirillum rugosum]